MDWQRFIQQHGRFAIDWQAGDGALYLPITLNCYRPEGVAADAPLVLVQHGVLRNGDDYRDFWMPAADRYGLQIIAPTFGNGHWPGVESYNNGSVWSEAGDLQPRAYWAYQAVANLAQQLRDAGVVQQQPLYLFGHSAGGQFVHRLVSTLGAAGFAGVAAGNPGWYTLPDAQQDFPQGLAGIGLTEDALAQLLRTPLVILAGDRDTDTQDPNLPAEPAALRQGPHRFARAHHYYAAGLQAAARLGIPLAWQLHEVAGIGHDGEAMSHVCAHLWFEGRMPDADWLAPWAGRVTA
ncbi:alpha/beta hydrolase [Comamonas sp. MYb69]|uniref:alpha/beta hydrolase n=1 Tax=Comamonas sp. MYb69 TaxID=1848650 RepID=UPI00309D2F52